MMARVKKNRARPEGERSGREAARGIRGRVAAPKEGTFYCCVTVTVNVPL